MLRKRARTQVVGRSPLLGQVTNSLSRPSLSPSKPPFASCRCKSLFLKTSENTSQNNLVLLFSLNLYFQVTDYHLTFLGLALFSRVYIVFSIADEESQALVGQRKCSVVRPKCECPPQSLQQCSCVAWLRCDLNPAVFVKVGVSET